MITPDQVLTEIAKLHLNIRTLAPRMSDALDFHNVTVWSVKAALAAAFDAGAQSSRCISQPDGTELIRFDGYEIQPCRRYFDAEDPDRAFVELCAPFEADFWTLYGHTTGEGVHAIGDFGTRQHAEEVFAKITGRGYADGNNKSGGRKS